MLEQVDPWFLKLATLLLAGYFLWSIRRVLADFKEEVRGLKDLIGKLFDNDKDYEKRLSYLEGKCRSNHGERE